MLKDITLGQYFPGNTIAHRLDPRTKLFLTVVYITILLLCKSAAAFAFVFLLLCGMIAASGVPVKVVLKSLRGILFILLFTALLNLFLTRGTPLVSFWRITITKEGLVLAVSMLLRLTMLISGTFLLTYTTSPLALTDGLERVMSPLKVIRFPAYEISLMMSIALRFIPTLLDETNKIMSAQKSRGANFETGNVFSRVRALVPVLIPLFVSSFKRAEELAEAMESRGYNSGIGRTQMKTLKMAGRDAVTFAASVLTVPAVVLLNLFGDTFFARLFL